MSCSRCFRIRRQRRSRSRGWDGPPWAAAASAGCQAGYRKGTRQVRRRCICATRARPAGHSHRGASTDADTHGREASARAATRPAGRPRAAPSGVPRAIRGGAARTAGDHPPPPPVPDGAERGHRPSGRGRHPGQPGGPADGPHPRAGMPAATLRGCACLALTLVVASVPFVQDQRSAEQDREMRLGRSGATPRRARAAGRPGHDAAGVERVHAVPVAPA